MGPELNIFQLSAEELLSAHTALSHDALTYAVDVYAGGGDWAEDWYRVATGFPKTDAGEWAAFYLVEFLHVLGRDQAK
jgi:hypothetical protein